MATFSNVEIKVKGFLRTALSAEASTATIDVDFVNEDDTSTAVTIQSDTLMFEIDPLNKTGKGSEIILATSNTADTPVTNRTRLSTVTRGLSKEGHEQTGSATRARSWDVGTEVSIATGAMAKMFNLMVSEHTTIYPSNGIAIQAPVYADATARDAAITSPSNGMYCYNTAEGVVQQYTGGAWTDVGDTGTANGSETVAGKYEGATTAEQGAATEAGSTSALLVPLNKNIVKTSSGAGDENKLAVLNSAGQFDSGFVGLPTGIIIGWGAAAAPSGYLLCNGAAVSRTTYSDLFGVIGTTFGVGDGSTTFNVPDLSARFPTGYGTLGATGGAATVDLSHTHTVPYDGWSSTGGNNSGALTVNNGTNSFDQVATASLSTGSGGSSSQSILPPYLSINYIIKT